MRICCSWTNFCPEALKFRRVRKFCKIQFWNRISRIIHHTIVRISSTSMIQHTTSTLELRWSNRRVQRFSFRFTLSFPCCFGCARPQFLRGKWQILWIVEDCRGQSFLSKWSFKNVSCNTRTILCITRQSRIAARQGSGTRNTEVWSGTWVAPELLAGSGS